MLPVCGGHVHELLVSPSEVYNEEVEATAIYGTAVAAGGVG
jgi:hypothetical protein